MSTEPVELLVYSIQDTSVSDQPSPQLCAAEVSVSSAGNVDTQLTYRHLVCRQLIYLPESSANPLRSISDEMLYFLPYPSFILPLISFSSSTRIFFTVFSVAN